MAKTLGDWVEQTFDGLQSRAREAFESITGNLKEAQLVGKKIFNDLMGPTAGLAPAGVRCSFVERPISALPSLPDIPPIPSNGGKGGGPQPELPDIPQLRSGSYIDDPVVLPPLPSIPVVGCRAEKTTELESNSSALISNESAINFGAFRGRKEPIASAVASTNRNKLG